MVGHYIEGAGVVLNRRLIVTLLPGFVALRVKVIRLLLLRDVLVVLFLVGPALRVRSSFSCSCPLLCSLMVLPRGTVVVVLKQMIDEQSRAIQRHVLNRVLRRILKVYARVDRDGSHVVLRIVIHIYLGHIVVATRGDEGGAADALVHVLDAAAVGGLQE